MPVGTSEGEQHETDFDFQVSKLGGAIPKEGQTLPETHMNMHEHNQEILDFITPDYLKQPEFDPKATLPEYGKTPEIERDFTGQMTKTALDVATSVMPTGVATKAITAGAGAAAKLTAKMKAGQEILNDIKTITKSWHETDFSTVGTMKSWEEFNKQYDTLADYADTKGIWKIAKDKIAEWKEKFDQFDEKYSEKMVRAAPVLIAPVAKYKYMKHLEPVEWTSLKSPKFPELATNDYSADPIAKKAKDAGFNIDFPLFKGGKDVTSVPDPANKAGERGIFYSDNPNIAQEYGEHTGTYIARAPKAFEVDWPKATGTPFYTGSEMTPLIEAARAKKADMLIVKNIKDMGGHQNQYVVLNPAVVRRPDAQFNPDHLHLNHLLAGIGGFGVVAHEGFLSQDK